MIVELVGHAGAGKTTFALDLERVLSRHGIPVALVDARAFTRDQPIRKRALQLYGLLRSPRVTLAGVRLLRSLRTQSWRRLGTLGTLAYRQIHVRKYQEDKRIVLVDEGVLHAIWSLTLHARQINGAELDKFIQRLMTPRHTISLRPDRESVMNNLRESKTHHRLSSRDTDALAVALDRQEEVLDLLESSTEPWGVVIRARRLTPESIEEVASQLMSLYGVQK